MEILPELSRESLRIADHFHIPVNRCTQIASSSSDTDTWLNDGLGDRLKLVEGDMLLFDGLGDARILMLTSQCWGKGLIQCVHDTLGAELKTGWLHQ